MTSPSNRPVVEAGGGAPPTPMLHESDLFRSLGKIEATLNEMYSRFERMERALQAKDDSTGKRLSDLDSRVSHLEKWRTYLIGATVGTVGLIVGAFVILNHALNAIKGVMTAVRP